MHAPILYPFASPFSLVPCPFSFPLAPRRIICLDVSVDQVLGRSGGGYRGALQHVHCRCRAGACAPVPGSPAAAACTGGEAAGDGHAVPRAAAARCGSSGDQRHPPHERRAGGGGSAARSARHPRARGRPHQSREPRAGRAGGRPTSPRAGGHEAVPGEGHQRSGGDGPPDGAEPECRARLRPLARGSRGAGTRDGAHAGGCPRALGRHLAAYPATDAPAVVGARHRVRHSAGLQP